MEGGREKDGWREGGREKWIDGWMKGRRNRGKDGGEREEGTDVH